MLNRAHEVIDPFRLATSGQILSGEFKLSGMHRLAPLLEDDQGTVHYEIEFGIDDMGIRNVHGHIQAKLKLLCQRCLQPMEFEVNTEVALGVVQSSLEAEQLPGHYEPLLVEGRGISLVEMIEDELLLAVPIVPMHALEQCEAATHHETGDGASGDAEIKENPFAILADLKVKTK
jgi:uncharacterized protein